MTHDLLERAAKAVRELHDGQGVHPSPTEQRMLFRIRAKARRRKRWLVVAVPLVAALLVSGAWARVKGNWPFLVRGAVAPPGLVPQSAVPVAVLPSHQKVEAAPPSVAEQPAVRPPPRSHAAAASSPVPRFPVPTPPDENALYRAAHRAQFAGSDPQHALALWDRYLSVAPNGALSPEARYNRAVTLVRLGRKSEARDALQPFARGDYGPYRQPEATALLGSFSAP